MNNQLTSKETREGFKFTARVQWLQQRVADYPLPGGVKDPLHRMLIIKTDFAVQFFVEGNQQSIGSIEMYAVENAPQEEDAIFKAFDKWVREGWFLQTVKDHNLLSVLTICQRERREGVVWYKRTWRFLRAAGSTHENPRLILTRDKSDVPKNLVP